MDSVQSPETKEEATLPGNTGEEAETAAEAPAEEKAETGETDKTDKTDEKDEQEGKAENKEPSGKPEKSGKPVKKDAGKKKTRKPPKRPPRPPQKKKPKTTKQALIGFLIKVAVIALVLWIVFTFILCLNVHYGNNMHPAIRDGDLLISLRIQKPYLNAAVLYEHDGETCVGRVIAMAGSIIGISDEGEMSVDGVVPGEEVFYPTFKAESSGIEFPYTVKEGEVFILNDFRSDTYDSRSFGGVSVNDLKGTVFFSMRRRGF